MCSCSAWCMIARRVSKLNICRLLMLHCLWDHGCEPEISCSKHFLVFACLWERGWRPRCIYTMWALMCVSVVVCVACLLQPCLRYSRRRDRINLGLWHSLYKGGGVMIVIVVLTACRPLAGRCVPKVLTDIWQWMAVGRYASRNSLIQADSGNPGANRRVECMFTHLHLGRGWCKLFPRSFFGGQDYSLVKKRGGQLTALGG